MEKRKKIFNKTEYVKQYYIKLKEKNDLKNIELIKNNEIEFNELIEKLNL
jgi:hypothetical protein